MTATEAVVVDHDRILTTLMKGRRPEARRLLAADLFARGKGYLEVARALVVSEEAARRWRLRWEAGGREALLEKRDGQRGPPSPVEDDEAHALMAEALELGLSDLTSIGALADKRKIRASRSALRRKLIRLGYWQATPRR